MKNLFYSPNEKILFWVAGYTRDESTNNVLEIIDSLKENATKFAEIAGVPVDEVKTFYNSRPPRYQYMRIFYCTTDTPPEGAFDIRNEDDPDYWTMIKWLTS